MSEVFRTFSQIWLYCPMSFWIPIKHSNSMQFRSRLHSIKHNAKWSFLEICWVVKQTGTNMGLQRHFTVNSLSNSNNYLTHMTSFHAMFRQHLWHLKVSNISLDQHLNLAKEDILKLTACILDIYQYMCKCEL